MTKYFTLALALSSFVLAGCAAQGPRTGVGMMQSSSPCPQGQVLVEGTCANAPTR